MQFGSLPEIFNLKSREDKIRYLHSYIHLYLKEEIISEQIIRNIEPFRYFLEVAGQCNGLNEYFETHYKLSYLRTKDGLEIDLILQKGWRKVFIEIKSTDKVFSEDLKYLKSLKKVFPKAMYLMLSLDKIKRKEDGVMVFPWQEGIKYIFNLK